MAFASFLSYQFCPKFVLNSSQKTQLTPLFISRSRYSHIPVLTQIPNKKTLFQLTCASFDFLSSLPNKKGFYTKNGDFLSIPFGAKSSGGWEEDHRALETVLKLYTAIKRRNLQELSDVIGDECRCVCNFMSWFHPFTGKKQVLELFSLLMDYMGKHIEFVVQPTLHDGMNVGVSWKLVWDKTHTPLGKGFSFYMCHTYQGRVVIRNMEMFIEPLLHIEPLRLKMMEYAMHVLNKIGIHDIVKGKGKRVVYFLLILVFTTVLIVLLTFYFF